MNGRTNILEAIQARNETLFLELLDAGFKAAAMKASDDSHRLRLEVVDGRKGAAVKPGSQ